MRLAAMLGRGVREVEDAMDAAEFAEWIAFDRAFGLPDVYFMTVQICMLLAQVFADPKRPRRPEPADFVPFLDPRPARVRADRTADVMAWLKARREGGPGDGAARNPRG
jgi:hypothetical protein